MSPAKTLKRWKDLSYVWKWQRKLYQIKYSGSDKLFHVVETKKIIWRSGKTQVQ